MQLESSSVAAARYFASGTEGVAANRDCSIMHEWLRELISPPRRAPRPSLPPRLILDFAPSAPNTRGDVRLTAVTGGLRPARRVHFQTHFYICSRFTRVSSPGSCGVKSRWRKLRTHAKLILRGFVDPATARRLFSRYRAPFPLSHARNVTHARRVYYENTWRDCRLSRIGD